MNRFLVDANLLEKCETANCQKCKRTRISQQVENAWRIENDHIYKCKDCKDIIIEREGRAQD